MAVHLKLTWSQNRFIAEPLHEGIVTYLRENGDPLMPESLVMMSLYTCTSAMMLRSISVVNRLATWTSEIKKQQQQSQYSFF